MCPKLTVSNAQEAFLVSFFFFFFFVLFCFFFLLFAFFGFKDDDGIRCVEARGVAKHPQELGQTPHTAKVIWPKYQYRPG